MTMAYSFGTTSAPAKNQARLPLYPLSPFYEYNGAGNLDLLRGYKGIRFEWSAGSMSEGLDN